MPRQSTTSSAPAGSSGSTAGTSSDLTYTRPRTRQRIRKTPTQLHVPDINDDAAERKRVLNVLAQRRYRERRRKGISANDEAEKAETAQSTSANASSTGVTSQGAGPSRSPPGTILDTMDASDPLAASSLDMNAVLDMDLDSTWPTTTAEFLAGPTLSVDGSLAGPGFAAGTLGDQSPPSTINPSILTTFSSSSQSPSTTSTSMTTPPSFPDTYLLPMPELTLLKGLLRIAFRLGIKSEIWLPQTLSPFYLGSATPEAIAALPAAWRPTPTQCTVPHHPVLDLLPWPSARDRMIQVLALPTSADGDTEDAELVDMMPMGGAGCDRALVLSNLVYDLEDGCEGLRIWGGDPYDSQAWEVGQVVFERWWFMFDHEIVSQSDGWREMRGAQKLSLGRGMGGVGAMPGSGIGGNITAL